MQPNPAFGGAARSQTKSARSIACLAFVGMLAIAFWAGALWIAQVLLHLLS